MSNALLPAGELPAPPKQDVIELMDKMIAMIPASVKRRHEYKFFMGKEMRNEFVKQKGKAKSYRGYKILSSQNSKEVRYE